MLYGEICLAEAEVKGRSNKSIIDHILTLNSVIQQNLNEQKQAYVAFIDLEKAYNQNKGIKEKYGV